MSSAPVTNEELLAYKKAFKDFAEAIEAVSAARTTEPHIDVPRRELTTDELLDIYCAQKPKLVWRVSNNLLPTIKWLTDSTGRYVYATAPPDGRSCLLGHPIEFVEAEGVLRLVTVGGNRE